MFQDKFKKVLDVGCGIGANIQYFSKHFPGIHFTGWDILSHKLEKQNEFK